MISRYSLHAVLCGLLLTSQGLLLACQEESTHPPVLSSCAPGQACQIDFGTVRGPAQGGATGIGSGGQGGIGAATSVLSGTVIELIDDTFRNGVQFSESALVEGEGLTTALVSARWDGINPFQLSGVIAADPAWISVRAERDPQNLRTLHPITTTVRQSVPLGLVSADTLDAVYRALTVPEARTAGLGHAVLRFKSATAGKIAGVSVVLPDAGFSAYQDSGFWSVDAGKTDGSGLVILGNITTRAFPGSSKRVVLGGSSFGYVDLQVAADSVSLVEIQL